MINTVIKWGKNKITD